MTRGGGGGVALMMAAVTSAVPTMAMGIAAGHGSGTKQPGTVTSRRADTMRRASTSFHGPRARRAPARPGPSNDQSGRSLEDLPAEAVPIPAVSGLMRAVAGRPPAASS